MRLVDDRRQLAAVTGAKCPRQRLLRRSVRSYGTVTWQPGLDNPQADALYAVWLVLNHPDTADKYRQGVSVLLREHNRACLTIAIDTTGRTMSTIGDRFDNKLGGLLTKAVHDVPAGFRFYSEPPDDEPPLH